MTSAEIVIAFIRGRPLTTEPMVRRAANDPWQAPEVIPGLVRDVVMDAFREVSDTERAGLDRMRGNGDVIWADVAKAFRTEEG